MTRHGSISYTGFLSRVERDAGLSRPEAERAVHATLQSLAERLSAGQARNIAARLPRELARSMTGDKNARPYDLKGFIRRVAEREGVDAVEAAGHVRAVFAALGRAITLDELNGMASELPKDFGPVLVAAQPPPFDPPERLQRMTTDEFVERVAIRTGLDLDGARRATDAVLEALADRISGGQVDDLADQLPLELHPALERGKVRSHGAARPLSLEDFVRVVAELEGVPPDAAREHARAVVSTLRDAVSDKEFADTMTQLPDQYQVLLAPPAVGAERR